MTQKKMTGFDREACNKQHRQEIIDILAALREQLGTLRRIAANEEFSKDVREKAQQLIPLVMKEMDYERGHLQYERRLEELESR